ncbi:alanyl (membrane) aminopeptidase b, tandem duplicate 1 [Denticeps clupeoides]|uniref:alanyl (membrane) aminopeptidase b, tandem duplicate 1 n=1 Tax=Denticeps clupeoides TaxID=299321 RepID=UPI0010A3BB7C|nr:aminopeptidase N-like [Denticeps clupeoides]
MGKGLFISKTVGVVCVVLAAGAVATIIALSVVYSQEKSKNADVEPTSGGTSTAQPTAQPTEPPSNEPWDKYRLPDSLEPEFYTLTLWPRLQKNTDGLYVFTGKSTVRFRCKKETNLILIHSNKLELSLLDNQLARLSAVSDPSPPRIQKSWLQQETQYLVLQLTDVLKADQIYELYTEFQGELADDLGGFYRSVYTEDGVEKVIATTQMQPTDARKAFPCFDEPAMKAIFNITLIHDQNTVALSNSNVLDEFNTTEEGIDVTKTTFHPTERMSTYLLAFIVCEFDFENRMEGDVMIRIFARKKAIEAGQAEYALNKTGPILKFFEEYYNSSYPLEKSDQIALPDFNAGAMENWGLITYRETALLYDPAVSSNGNKERIATIIAHELAHMWFGNLVTLKWWNDLWLNEGFASYVEYLGADYAEPTWNVKDLIVLGDMHRVFAIDALASSHPLSSKEEDIQKPAEIAELFDAISYSKGACVLRMLSNFLTEPIFLKGLQSYLNAFAFGNTVYTDLWDHLQAAVDSSGMALPNNKKVHDIMNPWILQMGFPVVTIDTSSGTLTQKHFLLDPESTPSDFIWDVPIQWMKTGDEKPYTWLHQKEELNDQMRITAEEWLVANVNVTGYYRVNYDDKNWDNLLNQLNVNHEDIPVLNRAQLIDDAFNLARANIVPTTRALQTTSYLSKERNYMAWESALDNLDYFYLMFDRSEIYGLLQAYTRRQVTPLFNYFKTITDTWTKDPDGHTEQYNEVNALRMACSSGLTECNELVQNWYKEWMTSPDSNPIRPNLRSTVYCSAIAAGGEEEWNFGWQRLKEAAIAIEADKLRAALACTTKPWLLNRYLEFTLNATQIRKQDATSTIVYIANNVVGQPLAWDFVRTNWQYIFQEYGGGSFSFANLINGVTKRFSTPFDLKQLEQFKEENANIGFGSGTLAVEQSIERTKANIAWVNKNREVVKSWLESELSY